MQVGLSAMASGIPIVAHVAGRCASFARHLSNSVFFDSMSSADICNAVLQATDKNLQRRLSAGARETGLAHSQRYAAREYLSMLRRCVGVDISLSEMSEQ
jgi:hypothetical protein